MASYADSVLKNSQSVFTEEWEKAEMRSKQYPTITTFKENQTFLFPDAVELREREDRAQNTYLRNRTTATVGSARSYNHTGGTSDSTEGSLVWTTYTRNFQTSLKRGDNNMYNDQQIMMHELKNAFLDIEGEIETDMVTYLDTNKTQVSDASTAGTLKNVTFNGTNFVFEVASADESRYWQYIKSTFQQEKYSGMDIDIIADPKIFPDGEFYAVQGTQNSTNTAFQFSGMTMQQSIELADTNYANGFSFGFPKGMVGMLDWIPKQNRQGKGDYESYVGGFGTITSPTTGLEYALHGYSQRADTSSANGSAQDVVIEWEVSIDISNNHAPITTANQSPILAFGIPT